MNDAAGVANTNVPRKAPTEAEAADETQINVPRAVTEEIEGPVEGSSLARRDVAAEALPATNEEPIPGAIDTRPATNEDTRHATNEEPRRDRRSRAHIKTARLDSRDFLPSWPIAIATLEQLSGWAVLALRLGTLALIQQCVRELAEENARADTIVRLRALTDALAHMPLEA